MRPRTVMLSAALVLTFAALAVPATQADSLLRDRTAPQLVGLRAYTLSPAEVRRRPAAVRDDLAERRRRARHGQDQLHAHRASNGTTPDRTDVESPRGDLREDRDLRAGSPRVQLEPRSDNRARTYLTLLDVRDAAGNRRTYGARNAETGRRPTAPVIRVLGVEAGFTRESYVPGDTATLAIETDAIALSLQVFRAGPEDVPTYNDTLMNGVPVTEPVNVGWSGLDGPGTIDVPIGEWASGLYFAKLTDENGRDRIRPVRAPPRPTRGDTRRGDPPHEHVAGVQLPRRERQRLGRHLVRQGLAEHRPTRTCVSPSRRSTPVQEVRPRLPPLARPARQAAGLPQRDRSRGAERRHAREGSTTSSSSAGTRST